MSAEEIKETSWEKVTTTRVSDPNFPGRNLQVTTTKVHHAQEFTGMR